MERKFVLLIKTEDSKYCWKGERTQEQIKKDLNKLSDNIEAEILPVIGKTTNYIPLVASGLLLIGLGTKKKKKTHENLYKRRKRC